MSTAANTSGAASRQATLRDRYEAVVVPVVEHEDRLSAEAAQEIWEDIYGLFRANSEEVRDAVRVAVYAYFAVNGTSSVGKYSRNILSGSESVPVHEVVKQITGGTIREFFRTDVVDAYFALKGSGVLESDEVFMEKSIAKGAPRGFAHCAVDFLRGCPDMTQEEKRYAELAFKTSVQRASAARGGKSLDRIASEDRVDRNVTGTRADSAGGQNYDEF